MHVLLQYGRWNPPCANSIKVCLIICINVQISIIKQLLQFIPHGIMDDYAILDN